MPDINFKDFKSTPTLYTFFLCLIAVGYLYKINSDQTDKERLFLYEQIKKLEQKVEKKDSVITELYQIVGVKKTVNALNEK